MCALKWYGLVAHALMSLSIVNMMEDQFPKPCHPERSPSDVGERTESKDPENLSLTMQRQGILTSTFTSSLLGLTRTV